MSRKDGLDDLYRSLPTQTIFWFYDLGMVLASARRCRLGVPSWDQESGQGDMQPPGPRPCNPPAAATGPRDPRPGRPRAFAATSPRRGEAQPDPDPGRPRGERTPPPAALRGFPGAGKGGWEAAGAPFSWGSRAPAGCSLCCRLERFCHLVINASCQEKTNFLHSHCPKLMPRPEQ